jgi:DNA polymerase elongation subunit (family B)
MTLIRLLDFKVYDEKTNTPDSPKSTKVNYSLIVQLFGNDEHGNTYSCLVEDFKPYFYLKCDDSINEKMIPLIQNQLEQELSYNNSISSITMEYKKTLYGFDDGKTYPCLKISMNSLKGFNNIKYVIQNYIKSGLVGYPFNKTYLEMYETNIQPILRFFHEYDIQPAGWISIDENNVKKVYEKNTTCTHEFRCESKYIKSENNIEKNVPLKICSFDIEALSSHGDFPLARKNYKRLANQIVEFWESEDLEYEDNDAKEECCVWFSLFLMSAFGYGDCSYVDVVELKKKENREVIQKRVELVIKDNKQYVLLDLLTDKKNKRDFTIEKITARFDKYFPPLKGDIVTFIGSTFRKNCETEPYLNHIIALNTCDSMGIENEEIVTCYSEQDVLIEWCKIIQREDPDIIIGYNIFGFDYRFLLDRANELGRQCCEAFLRLSRINGDVCASWNQKIQEYESDTTTISIASGTHELHYLAMTGRIQIDMYNYFRREYNLESYKLDYVSGYFIRNDITNVNDYWVHTKTEGLKVGNYIHIEEIGHSSDYYDDGKKFEVVEVKLDSFRLNVKINPNFEKKVIWCLAKDDVSPQDIFNMTRKGSKERAVIAKYCIQDCNLVQHLFRKIDVLTGFTEMSNLCSVPIEYLVIRGQGIKLFSFVAKKCREFNTILPVLTFNENDKSGYEGAIVLEPKCGLYLTEPVACVDYSSLYPSSMISENLSHDSKVWSKEYDLYGNIVKTTGIQNEHGEFTYDNLDHIQYTNIKFDTYEYIPKSKINNEVSSTDNIVYEKKKNGFKIVRFAKPKSKEKAIMPSILEALLKARKQTRAQARHIEITDKNGNVVCGRVVQKNEETITLEDVQNTFYEIRTCDIYKQVPKYDTFMKNVLDKRQLAIKVTANSLYGQCGAKTSSFFEQDVAAATTATGRTLLQCAKRCIEEIYGDKICETTYGKVHSHAEYIYGDTDSVFMSFKLTDLQGNKIEGKEALKHTIELAKRVGRLVSKFLRAPHELEYEKTFMPFCLLSKKRYVGMLYEECPNTCVRKSMGIVLKRRDNAPIVKDIYGGIIDILMKEQNVKKAIEFMNQSLQKLTKGQYPLEKLIITKSLRDYYKNPSQIAHKVLAERIGQRNPGNKPRSGDRIPFVYIKTKANSKTKLLQGDKIEHPQFIRDNPKLKPDYSFYITNQIMKPVQQLFGLVLDDIPGFNKVKKLFDCNMNTIYRIVEDEEQLRKKQQSLRDKYVKQLLFDSYLLRLQKNQPTLSFSRV